MKRLKSFFLLLILFSMTGCDIFVDYESPGEIIIVPEEEIIIDEEYSFTPFANLEELKNEDEFQQNIYPVDQLEIINQYISLYGFVSDENLYSVGSAYYSTKYDTLYVSYRLNNGEYLSTYDLYLIERHAIAYFETDSQRSEDLNYLKAVLIYPDENSSCDNGGGNIGISGCANYGGLHATISLNSLSNIEDFYNPITSGNYLYEPKRDTFAHEYGHVATFYHMVYKGDESYEDYLSLRLDDEYSEIYPNGLPQVYTTDIEYYKIQPEEVLADDFVELFYYREAKFNNDLTYTQKYEDWRSSLSNHTSIQFLAQNYLQSENYLQIKEYYTNNFYNLNRTKITPIVVSPKSGSKTFSYYDSATKLNVNEKLSSITSIFDVNLIAVEIVKKDNIEYYRVVLSPLSKTKTIEVNGINQNIFDKKEVGNNMGYVRKELFQENTQMDVYKVSKGWNGTTWVNLAQGSLLPVTINDSSSTPLSIFVTPFYDFAYVTNLGETTNNYYMYDYLRSEVSLTQKFLISKGSLQLVD